MLESLKRRPKPLGAMRKKARRSIDRVDGGRVEGVSGSARGAGEESVALLALPDLLHLTPRLGIDRGLVDELLDLAFMGKDTGSGLDQALGSVTAGTEAWNAQFFAHDLFVRELLDDSFSLSAKGYAVNTAFLMEVVSSPPVSAEAVHFRQEIVRELESSPAVLEQTRSVHAELHDLLTKLKLPGHAARLDINAYRLDVLRQAKVVIDGMESGFAGCYSGLRRLHEAGADIQSSREYGLLQALLEYEQRMSVLDLRLNIGAAGRITDLEIRGIEENTANRFHRAPWRRLLERLKLLWHGYSLSRYETVGRVVEKVFQQLLPGLTPLVQLLGHLEFYLTNLEFAARARERGLEVCLPTFDGDASPVLHGLFNPLLLEQEKQPIPCDIDAFAEGSITLVTGPNSGGKTRLLQALGLSQVLGQSGLYVPAREARLHLVGGLFVSLIEREAVEQTEGRLGRELMRIRTMFQAMGSSSMVILDELCSGTNPSEGIEVFRLVLRLLEKLGPAGCISTHFLDFARELEIERPISGLRFLQVEVGADHTSNYQFVPGVAKTSLAGVMAERLGMTFEELTSRPNEGGKLAASEKD